MAGILSGRGAHQSMGRVRPTKRNDVPSGLPDKRLRAGRKVNGQELCKKWSDKRGCDGTCGKLNCVCVSKKHNCVAGSRKTSK